MPIITRKIAGAVLATSLMSSFLLWNGTAQAKTPKDQPNILLAAVKNNTVRVKRGAQVVLPMSGVTRVVAEDEDIARGSFLNGRAVLEGVSTGETTVEIYQGNSNTPRLLSVSVQEIALDGSSDEVSVTEIAPLPNNAPAPNTLTPIAAPAITPATSPLNISLSVAPAPGNPSQALFTITYGNPTQVASRNAVARFALDEKVSYVTGSASGNARYDAATREVVWNLGTVAPGQTDQRLTLRVEPIQNRSATFESTAQISDDFGSLFSNQIIYTNATTPLLTVFALPDRFLAGRNSPVLVDVKGSEFQSAVDRLQSMGVISGREAGLFYPAASTQRAEYTVMTLNGLNLRDLRDITQIKFVLGRPSTVNLIIQDEAGKPVATLVRNTIYEPGEHTAVWNGRVGTGYAAPGRYTYICTAKDAKGELTKLKSQLTIVPQAPLLPQGMPSFVDVKPSDWFAGYLAVGEKQGLINGYSDKTFRPAVPISRIEATAIVVRALGLEDLARQMQNTDVGFLDYQNIPDWGRKYVAVASTIAKTSAGKTMVRGNPNNFFYPDKDLRRDEAAVLVQRLIDRETNRSISIRGAMVPGTTVTINSRTVQADAQGQFQFSIEANTGQPTTVAVIDTRGRVE